jgi:uncharacterized protein (DUF952 family)
VLIYKIACFDDWTEALESGSYLGSAKDKEDGFVHFSTGEQLVETLRLHYPQTEDMLAISSVDAEALGDALKWEPSRGGALFPHLYGPLPYAAVTHTVIAFYFSFAEDDFARVRDFIGGKGI